MSSIFDNDHSMPVECFRGMAEHDLKSPYDRFGSGIAQPEDHHPSSRTTAEGHDLCEIQVERQDDAIVRSALREDLPIGQSVKSLIA